MTGFGVIEERGGHFHHLGHGVIRAVAKAPLEIRLREIFIELTRTIVLYRPDAVAVEGLFAFKNARSALILGHARGIALLVAAQTDLPVHEYPPARVKKSVGAGGAGDKGAVMRMVTTFLRLPVIDQVDASDALAVAICHLNHSRTAFSPPVATPRLRPTASPAYIRFAAVK